MQYVPALAIRLEFFMQFARRPSYCMKQAARRHLPPADNFAARSQLPRGGQLAAVLPAGLCNIGAARLPA